MAEGLFVLRPHHINTFINYLRQPEAQPNDFSKLQERYGKDFVKKLSDFFDLLISGERDEEYILIKNGLDTICYMCPKRAGSCSEPDSLSLWYNSGLVMQDMGLKEGWLYSVKNFIERIKSLHPEKLENGKIKPSKKRSL